MCSIFGCTLDFFNHKSSTISNFTLDLQSLNPNAYLNICPVCHPSSQLVGRKPSDLQLIGVWLARFPFGWEVEEGWSRVHIKLQKNRKKWHVYVRAYTQLKFNLHSSLYRIRIQGSPRRLTKPNSRGSKAVPLDPPHFVVNIGLSR